MAKNFDQNLLLRGPKGQIFLPHYWGRGGRYSRRRGFTLVEALVAIVLVSIGVVAVFSGIRSLGVAEAKAQSTDLLQRLALQKMNEVDATVSDPNTFNSSGDFSNQGYPDITWSIDVQQEDAQNLDQVTVTTTRSGYSQSVTSLFFVVPQTTSGSTGNTGGALP